MRDLHHNIKARQCIKPVAVGTTGTGQTGKVIDREGFDSVEFILDYGSVTATNATITPTIVEGDATGSLTSVADADLLGTEANAGIGQAATRTSGVSKLVTKRIGYIGKKRYVNCKLISTVTAGPLVAASTILGHPQDAPVAT